MKRKTTIYNYLVFSILSFFILSNVSLAKDEKENENNSINFQINNNIQDTNYEETIHEQIGWIKQGEDWFYLYETGEFATGWIEDNGIKYFLDSNGVMQTGWLDYQGNWYYLKYWGGMAEKSWIKDKNTWYYLKENGVMQTGWLDYQGNWYYLKYWGGMAEKSWIKDKNTWYYLKENGVMQTGWLDYQGNWYYLKYWGGMATGWNKINNKNEFFDNSGIWYRYQNPSGYYQLSYKNVKLIPEAYKTKFSYVTPSVYNPNFTKREVIETFINRSADYIGTPYVWNYSREVGVGVDCIGLIYQAAYSLGMDLGEFNPYNHWITGPNGWHSHDANNFWNYGKTRHLPLSQRQRGDIIYWPGHVAIYLGNNKILEAYPNKVRVASLWVHGTPRGVMRIFN